VGARIATSRRAASTILASTANRNVEQTQDTSRERIMTFVYDDENKANPTAMRKRKGTGSGMSGDGLDTDEYDIIVIGSGVGGLACGALSAKYGDKTLVVEAHQKAGGSAHTFTRMHEGKPFSFEVGPSIFEGLHAPSINPLRMIIDILGEDLPAKTYSGIGYWTPEGFWRFPIGSQAAFEQTLLEQCGPTDGPLAIAQWNALRARLKTLSGSTQAVSLLNLRQDAGFLATTAGSLPYVASHPDIFGDLGMLFDSLHKVVDEYVTVPFLRNFVDTMCIFCGFPAKGAMTAHMLYILERFFEPGACAGLGSGGWGLGCVGCGLCCAIRGGWWRGCCSQLALSHQPPPLAFPLPRPPPLPSLLPPSRRGLLRAHRGHLPNRKRACARSGEAWRHSAAQRTRGGGGGGGRQSRGGAAAQRARAEGSQGCGLQPHALRHC
jgi:hypothetical protein